MRVEKPPRNIDFPATERTIIQKWEKENTFQRSIDIRSNDKKFNFYDGPPFATGLPHFGHFVPGSIKDAFPRYFTMKGYRVERRFGWDCHGLPVEMIVQKELGLNGRGDIEALGIAKFNEACRQTVLRYTAEWRAYMKRLGRWVDMENEYRTMDPDFMESVWAVIKTLFEKGLVYEGKFVMSYSSALGSTLSNFEASLEYKEIQDPSVTIKAKLSGKHKGSSLLVWTTTPWTLPANVAIAVDAKGEYVEVEELATKEKYIVLGTRVDAHWPESAVTKLRTFSGAELVGESYEPFFDNYVKEAGPNAFKIYGTDYVLHDTGTGAVHTAPAFGEDDFRCAKQYNLPIVDHLDVNGHFLKNNPPEVVGLHFKAGDKAICADLKKRGMMFKHESFVHSYPMCYRSHTPLIYRAMPSWFVKVESIKDDILKANSEIHWVPDHIKDGRFGKWLENARDWNIARDRFWGNPIPIWKNNETGETLCIGSIAELEKYAGRKIPDLHMEHIDDITIPSPTGRGVLKRVPFVLDCWFESGSMPYAQMHYPFEHKDDFDKVFPADFICEGLDQTRGWFYTLTILSAALFKKPAFKNVVVNGIVLAADGRKMSKSLKNFPDPMETLESHGADATRLFLLSSPATVADEIRFSVEGVKECTRRVLLPLWNAYSFFSTYAGVDHFDPETQYVESKNELDVWAKLRVNELIREVDVAMSAYQIARAVPAIMSFLDDLNNWYIRRSRRRFWEGDKEAYSTLYTVLTQAVQVLAPFAPFAAEFFYEKLSLTKEMREMGSVHLTLLPSHRALTADENELLERVEVVRRVVELGRNIRTMHKIKNRQPLSKLTVGVLSKQFGARVSQMADVIKEELNVKALEISYNPGDLAKIIIKPNLKILGRALGERLKELQKLLVAVPQADAERALRKQTITLGSFELTPEMLIVELQPSGNHLVATDSDIVAALDPTITEELKMEGIARELVSLIQKARKSADFEVENRIKLKIDAASGLLAAIEKNKEYIEDETLSTLVTELAQSDYSCEETVEGLQIRLWLKRN